MLRSFAKSPSFTLSIVLLALTACGGGSGSGNPASIVLSPATSAAVAQGGVFQITATPEDSSGNALSNFTPTFAITSGGNLISVSTGGLLCAGHWDSLVTPVNCTAGTATGKATVTANVNSVASTPLIIDVLPPIDNLSVTGADIPADPAHPDTSGTNCISQTGTRTYTAKASFKGVDVPLTGVTDAITWSTITGVGTIAVTTNSTTGVVDSRSATVTAGTPGKTQVTAGLFNVPGAPWLQSTPADFITCPVSSIQIADSTAATVSPSPLASAATVTLTPTIKDSRNNTVALNDAAGVAIFSLFWNSSQPSVASAGGTGVVTANASTGTSSVIASCTPPSCNAGLGAVYSNVYVTNVTGTVTTRTVYIGSMTPTAGLTLLPMNTSDGTFGTAITLGDVPNSMMFDPAGNNLYIGTNTGLIILAAGGTTASTVGTGIPGKILAISPDSGTVIISNTATSQVFIYSVNGGTYLPLPIPGAVAAAFAPDSSKAYILGNNTLSVYSGGSVTATMPISGAQSATFLASGALSYIAASGTGLGNKATCDDSINYPVIPTSGTPTLVNTLPDGQNLVAVAATNLDLINVPTDNVGFVSQANGCAPVPPIPSLHTLPLNGGTTFTAKQLIVTPDGSKAYVLSDAKNVPGVSISGTPLTLSDASITLSGNAVPTTGGVTLDSTTLFVGGSDGKIHKVNLSATPTTADSLISLPSTAPAGFTPDFVAVQPK